TPILPDGKVLMEIKCSGGIPLWMIHVLSKERIYKTSFSKYGTAYQRLIFPTLKEAVSHV
ncbi:MAG: molecular chaperone, partial [Clostridia bacterium]|nr:molecular chaperone [Clostridia bacterium]